MSKAQEHTIEQGHSPVERNDVIPTLERTIELLEEAYGRAATCGNCPAARGCRDDDCSDMIGGYCRETAERGEEL